MGADFLYEVRPTSVRACAKRRPPLRRLLDRRNFPHEGTRRHKAYTASGMNMPRRTRGLQAALRDGTRAWPVSFQFFHVKMRTGSRKANLADIN
jgi:hypothetical protein